MGMALLRFPSAAAPRVADGACRDTLRTAVALQATVAEPIRLAAACLSITCEDSIGQSRCSADNDLCTLRHAFVVQ